MLPKLDPLLRWLETKINLESKPSAGSVDGLSLAGVESLLRLLGNPHLEIPAVHITGTNGKGSTAQLTSRILAAHGLGVGSYGSPHVEDINERIQLGAAPISDETLALALADVKLASEHAGMDTSWFECMTAAAFRVFSDEAVDAAVIEVGMLGRHDATNVAATRVAVVTNVDRDHTDGSSGWRESIAREKAGIIKPDSTLVLGPIEEDLMPIFLNEEAARVQRINQDFALLENDLAMGGRNISVRTSRGQYDDLFVGLHGQHQGLNAMLAIVAAEEFLDSTLEDELLGAALAEPFMPARFEVVGVEPLIVLDGSHNPAGAASAAHTLRSDFGFVGDRYLLLGWMTGRDPAAMLEAFGAREAELVVITEPRWPRVMPAAEIAAAADTMGISYEVVASPLDGLDRVRTLASDGDAILVAGSFYLAGPVRRAIREDREAAERDDA